jgi:poly(3-hydroxybutyrate) depolymerase
MLYQLHEFQKSLLHPLSSMAEVGASVYSNPFSPLSYAPFARRIAAGYELMHRLGKAYEKPAFGITEVDVDGLTVQVVERHALKKPFCTLLNFKKVFPEGHTPPAQPKLLVVAPLSGHFATLLRDTVRALIPHHDVYVTDWQDAKMVPLSEGVFHLHDYVHYIIKFVHFLGEDVNLMSVCQPTVPVLAAVSLMSSNQDPLVPKTMTMMGGPIDARKSPTAVNTLAVTKPYSWFENNVIFTVPHNYPGYLRRVYPGFLQHAGFVAMNPDRHVNSHHDFYLHLIKGDGDNAEAHRRFYDEYNAVLDMPAEYYLETIKTVFQDHALPLGTWMVDGQRVAPEDIRSTALFTIEGELDDISGSGQTEAAHDLCSNIPVERKKHLTAQGCGHYGIFSGRRWREIICPQIREFILTHG